MKVNRYSLSKFHLIMFLVASLALSREPLFGSFQLEKISVECDGNTTLALIQTDGVPAFQHFKLGDEMFRVVVDLKETVNPAGVGEYGEFPCSNLVSIRTSQFSYEPLVARVVFDFAHEIEWRAEQQGEKLSLFFSTPEEQRFPSITVFQAEAKIETKKQPEPTEIVSAEKGSPSGKGTGELKGSSPPPVKRKGKEIFPAREKAEYRPRNPRDPFASLIGKEKPGGFVVSGLPRGEDLKLVGIIEEGAEFKALCEDDFGTGYILGEKDRLRDGYVASVEADRAVFIIEQYGWSRRRLLELPASGQ
jgi:hypothetical protein